MTNGEKMTKPAHTTATCRMCKEEVPLPITDTQVNDYIENRYSLPLIQDHFPQLNADQRELLLSGICGTCFDNMFS